MIYTITIEEKYAPIVTKLYGENVESFLNDKIAKEIKGFIDYNFRIPVISDDDKLQVVINSL